MDQTPSRLSAIPLAIGPVIERSHGVVVADYFAPELERLRRMAADGLVALEPRAVQVTPTGWFFVRAVAMVFDRNLQADRVRERFSRII